MHLNKISKLSVVFLPSVALTQVQYFQPFLNEMGKVLALVFCIFILCLITYLSHKEIHTASKQTVNNPALENDADIENTVEKYRLAMYRTRNQN